jgi:hypothetical protein
LSPQARAIDLPTQNIDDAPFAHWRLAELQNVGKVGVNCEKRSLGEGCHSAAVSRSIVRFSNSSVMQTIGL